MKFKTVKSVKKSIAKSVNDLSKIAQREQSKADVLTAQINSLVSEKQQSLNEKMNAETLAKQVDPLLVDVE